MDEKVLKKVVSTKDILDKDAISSLLEIQPELLSKFENAYQKHALNRVSVNFFQLNSRQAAKTMHTADYKNTQSEINHYKKIIDRIVSELLAQTTLYIFDGKTSKTQNGSPLSESKPVTKEELLLIPEEIRPQLTGELMHVDMPGPYYPHILFFYNEYINGKTEAARQMAYNMFRQGLDILDLDWLTYQIIGMNKNSIGYWFPKLVEACMDRSSFRLPATTIAKVPMTMLQLTRLDYQSLTRTTLDIVDRWAYAAFSLNNDLEYFIKTGTYSSKYDFRNAHVHGAKEVQELGEYLLFIHHQALQMASPLCNPCIFGVSTTNEWAVREFISDKEQAPCIYKGLPLHCEYRVFVDCDKAQVIGISPYWEPKTMLNHFSGQHDLHAAHDYVIYKTYEKALMAKYEKNKETVWKSVESMLPALDLPGQWSIDIMQNGEDFWCIDMALAENSAFYQCVPQKLRRPSKEIWIPKLTG